MSLLTLFYLKLDATDQFECLTGQLKRKRNVLQRNISPTILVDPRHLPNPKIGIEFR